MKLLEALSAISGTAYVFILAGFRSLFIRDLVKRIIILLFDHLTKKYMAYRRNKRRTKKRGRRTKKARSYTSRGGRRL